MREVINLGRNVLVSFSVNAEGVIVPEGHANEQSHMSLELGTNLPVPIRDLVYTKTDFSATLSFNRIGFHCAVPWDAIHSMQMEEDLLIVWAQVVRKFVPEPATRPTLRVVE